MFLVLTFNKAKVRKTIEIEILNYVDTGTCLKINDKLKKNLILFIFALHKI